MNNKLTNIIGASGTYNGVPLTLSAKGVETTLVTGLTLSLAADKLAWADGSLTYTVTIDNQTSLPYTTPTLTDTLDKTLITLLADSVEIDGTKATAEQYTYDAQTGLLTVHLSDVAATSKATVTFQVERV